MPRYIDADAFEADCRKRYCTGCENYNGIKCKSCWVDDMLGEVEDAPTIFPKRHEVRSRWNLATYSGKYGTAKQKWYDAFLDGAFWYCDNCKERARRSIYCPNCGAKMEVSEDA